MQQNGDENRIVYLVSDFRSKEWDNPSEVRQLLSDWRRRSAQIQLVNCVRDAARQPGDHRFEADRRDACLRRAAVHERRCHQLRRHGGGKRPAARSAPTSTRQTFGTAAAASGPWARWTNRPCCRSTGSSRAKRSRSASRSFSPSRASTWWRRCCRTTRWLPTTAGGAWWSFRNKRPYWSWTETRASETPSTLQAIFRAGPTGSDRHTPRHANHCLSAGHDRRSRCGATAPSICSMSIDWTTELGQSGNLCRGRRRVGVLRRPAGQH